MVSQLRKSKLKFLIGGIIAAALLSGGAFAQKSDKTPRAGAEAKLPAWIVSCSNANTDAKLICRAEQSLNLASTGQRIASVVFQRDATDSGQLKAIAQLPHGIQLTQGLTFWVDEGERQTVAIIQADQNGSYATIIVTPDLEENLKNGAMLRLLAKPVSGQDLVLELPLAGFTAALGAL
jgi:invasion protein IalB